MTTAISVAARAGAKAVICASTGNTSASAAAEAGLVPAGARIVCTVTGHGLKDPQWALRDVAGAEVQPTRVPVDAFTAAGALGLEG